MTKKRIVLLLLMIGLLFYYVLIGLLTNSEDNKKVELKLEYSPIEQQIIETASLKLLLYRQPIEREIFIENGKEIKKIVVGQYIMENGRRSILIDISQSYETIARVLVHEVAHANYNYKKDLDLGEKLPIPDYSIHSEKETTKEKIAIWFEEYIFSAESFESMYPYAYEIIDEIVNN